MMRMWQVLEWTSKAIVLGLVILSFIPRVRVYLDHQSPRCWLTLGVVMLTLAVLAGVFGGMAASLKREGRAHDIVSFGLSLLLFLCACFLAWDFVSSYLQISASSTHPDTDDFRFDLVLISLWSSSFIEQVIICYRKRAKRLAIQPA